MSKQSRRTPAERIAARKLRAHREVEDRAERARRREEFQARIGNLNYEQNRHMLSLMPSWVAGVLSTAAFRGALAHAEDRSRKAAPADGRVG